MTLSASEVSQLKQAPPQDCILPVFHQRWSPRSFSEREVSSVDLARLFEAARWTASAFNDQPWRFLVGRQGSSSYQKIFAALMPANQAWVKRAPVLILGVAKTVFSHNGAPNRAALYDLGGAVTALSLEAAHLGLSTHQMSGLDPETARAAFALPAEYQVMAAIAVGYQGDPEALENEKQREMEQLPRQRKELGEFVWSELDQPFEL